LAPDVLAGIRVASSLSLILTLLVDILGAGGGIGIQLEIRSASFDAAGAWGLLLVIGTIGYLASRVVAAIESFVLRNRLASSADR
jgi:sulfonate transport system permease protein